MIPITTALYSVRLLMTCGYVEVSGLVAPDFRHRGHFRNMLSICYRNLKSSSAGNLELIAPISGELLNCSLCGDVCFYEYLYQLDKAHFNLKSIQAAEPDNAEYYLEGDDYLMYLPEYEEPVALLYLDTQNTFVNVYGVFVDEKLRGKGIGTCLMKHFLKDYFNIASLPLVLNVTSRNKAAVALYKKCGFTEASRIEYHYIITSSSPAKITSCSPTIVPPLTALIPISLGSRFCLNWLLSYL